MKLYGKVLARFWTGPTGRKLRGDPDAQLLALYLVTCPASNMVGVYVLGLPTIAHETGLTETKLRRAFGTLRELNFAHYDEEASLVWVVNLARYQIGEELDVRDKRIPAIVQQLTEFRDHPFVSDWLRAFGGAFKVLGRGILRPFEAPSEPLRSQYQDQDQDQEQDQDPDKSVGLAPSVVSSSGPEAVKPEPGKEAVGEVLAHYQHLHPKHRPIARDSQLVRARLKEGYTSTDLIQAIDGYHRSPFHCGQNDRGQKYLALDLMLRDNKHVTAGIELAERPASPVKVNGQVVPVARPDCDFHRRGQNSGKPAPRHDFKADCPECRHLQARASPRPGGEASEVGDLLGLIAGGR